MPLNNEQRAAVEYLDGPLLVLAGPGTGKTQLLSAKVAYILENTDANPENILCLTFTEAGAQNMRDRLQSMIGKVAQDVNIHTYHAFGKNLLERYQNYAETLDRKLESSIDQTMQYKIVSDLQKKLSAVDILRDANAKDIIEVIGNAKAARLTDQDLLKIAEQNITDSQNISGEVSVILENAPKRCKFEVAVSDVYQPILAVLAKYSSPQPIVGNIERVANTLTRELNQIITKLEAVEKPSVRELTAWKTKVFEVDQDGKFRLKDCIANKKLLSIVHIMHQYDEYLQRNGLFDFNDMIERAIHYLKTDDGFRLSLSELFQYVLLDEFQDTNTSQFEIISLLTDYEKPIIMAVGDDDQAIYEFQGANASNLMNFQEHYQAKVITLVKNYRSIGDILRLSRHIADQIENSFANSYQDINKSLVSVKDQTAKPEISQIHRHEFPCAEAEYYWVSREIRKLVDAGEDAREIAILAPKHKNLVAILPYLKDQDLEIAYEKRENLLQDAKMRALITVSQFIWQLANGKQSAHQLLEILALDFWQIPAVKTIGLFSERFSNRGVLELLESHDELAPLAKFFAELATNSLTAPLELWLDYLIGALELNGYTSPYLEYYKQNSSEAELLEFYENLATFRQAVLAHAKALGAEQPDFIPKLADFIATINDYESAGLEIMRISNYSDATQSVQVMTAYKSKGLEFKHVFLTAVDDLSWGKAKGNNNLLALPRNLAQIRHTGISDDEKLRVLFVAMTRAKQQLIMTNSQANSDGKRIARLTYLHESSPEDVSQSSPYLPEETRQIVEHNELSTAEKISTLCLSWISHYQQLTPEIESILRSRVENYRLNASDLTRFIDLAYAGPQAVYQRTVLHAPSEPATLKQCYGNLAHMVFEQVTTQGLDNEAALAIFREAVPKMPLDLSNQALLLDLGLHNLQRALTEFGEILRHTNARAEVNLSPEHLVWDGVPITGKIDHIEINPDTKTIEIYDFKTGKRSPLHLKSHPAAHRYRLQLGFYKLLLNTSPTYQKYQITKGHILFVTPDQDGRVYDEVYEFNQADETKLRQLAKAVYRQITSLDFVKDSELFLPSDPNYSAKKTREFIEKLISSVEK